MKRNKIRESDMLNYWCFFGQHTSECRVVVLSIELVLDSIGSKEVRQTCGLCDSYLDQRREQRKTDIRRQNCSFDMAKQAWNFTNIEIGIWSLDKEEARYMQGTLKSQREHIDSMPGVLVSSEDVGLVDVLPDPREKSKQNMRLWNPFFNSIYAS